MKFILQCGMEVRWNSFYKDQLTEIDMTIWSVTWSTEVNEV